MPRSSAWSWYSLTHAWAQVQWQGLPRGDRRIAGWWQMTPGAGAVLLSTRVMLDQERAEFGPDYSTHPGTCALLSVIAGSQRAAQSACERAGTVVGIKVELNAVPAGILINVAILGTTNLASWFSQRVPASA